MDKSNDEVGFEIERSRDGTSYLQIAKVPSGTEAYLDTGLAPDTKYYYRMRAYNAAGNSDFSKEAFARTRTDPYPCIPSLVEWGTPYESPKLGLKDVKALAAGAYHSVALKTDGTVLSWDFGFPYTSQVPSNLSQVVAIAAGTFNTLAIKSDGTVVGWGYDTVGQVNPPVNLSNVVAVAAGAMHSLALKRDGTIVSWGDPLGRPPANLTGVKAIAAGGTQSAALLSNGTVVAWGYANSLPVQSPTNLTEVTAIAVGEFQGFALRKNGTVVSWSGEYFIGLPGIPTNLTGVVAIAAGGTHALALKGDGTVVEWGFMAYGGPMEPGELTGVKAIAAGYHHSLALATVPAKPSELYPTILATNRVKFSWRDNSGGKAGFILERAAYVEPINTASWQALAAFLPGSTSYTDATVVKDASYLYRIRAQNECGASPPTVPVVIKIVPPQPPYLTVNAFADEARLELYPQVYDGVTHFKIERWTVDANGLPGPWEEIATVAPSRPGYGSYHDIKLKLDQMYWYRVRCFNGVGGSDYAYSQGITIVMPAPPNFLSANIGNTNRVNLSWYAPTANDQVGFKLERALDVGGVPTTWAQIATIPRDDNLLMYTHSDAGVTAGATYWYRARTFNVLGDSDYCPAINIAVVAPPAPVLSGEPFADQAHLYWNLNYSGQVAGFKIERSIDSGAGAGPWVQIGSVNAETTDFVDRGLSTNAAYLYRVRTHNWLGESPYSDIVRIQIRPPSPPYNFMVAVGNSNTAHLSWWPQYPYDEAGYFVERAPDVGGNPGLWQQIGTTFATNYLAYSTFFDDKTVTTNATIWYRVRAFNVVGVSDYSPSVRIALTAPPAPTYLTATPFANQVYLGWDAAYNDYRYGEIISFKIERAPDVGGAPGTWAQIAVAGQAFAGYYTDTNLAPDATYWYRVRAFGWAGDSPYTTPVAVTIKPPGTPYLVGGTVGTNYLKVSWTAAQPYDQDGFYLERAPDAAGSPGAWTQIGIIAATNTTDATFNVLGVTANTTNWFRVRAFSAAGISPYSTPKAIVVSPPPPPNYLWTYRSINRVTVKWSSDFYYQYGVVSGFRIERAVDVNNFPGTWTDIGSVDFNASGGSYTDVGLTGNTTYWYRVRAYNWIGTGAASGPTIITVISPQPPFIFARVGTTNRVDLEMYGNPQYEQDGFRLERAPDAGDVPGNWELVANIAATNLASAQFADTNAVANTTNWYRAVSFNVLGTSAPNAPVRVAVVPPPPPEYLTAQPNANRILLHWDNYQYGNYGYVNGVEIERALDIGGAPGTWQKIGFAPTNNTSHVDTGLAPDTTYWYRVRTINWVGASAYCAPVSATIVPPYPPYNVTALIGGTNKVVVSWMASGGSDHDGFILESAPDVGGNPGAWLQLTTIFATNATAATFVHSNVTAYATYYYRARTFNAAGISDFSSPSGVMVLPPPAPYIWPASPFGDQIVLTAYGYYESYYGVVSGIKVERAPDVGGNPGAWTQIGIISPDPIYFADGNLPLGAKYWYRMRAFNWIGDGEYTDPVTATITLPGAPRFSSVGLGSTNRVNLSWIAAAPGDQLGFEIERAADNLGSPGSWFPLATVGAANMSSFSFTDTNVTAFTTNWYRVRAFNNLGVSDYSAPSYVKVVPPQAPLGLSGYPDATRVQLNWYEFSLSTTTGFRLQRAADVGGNPGAWTEIGVFSGSHYGSFTDPGRLPDTTYWYRVSAFNWVGDSPYTEPIMVTIIPAPTPQNLKGQIGYSSVFLEWNAGDPGTTEGFLLERAADTNGSPAVWSQIGNVPSSYYSFIYGDTNATLNATNWYRIRAYSAAGLSAYSAPVRVNVVPPPAPNPLKATVANGNITVSWPNEYWHYGYVSEFRVERAFDTNGVPGSWAQLAMLPTYPYPYETDTSVTTNVTYWYRVQALNWLGGGPYTTPVAATVMGATPITSPVNPEVRINSVVYGNSGALISWVVSDGSATVVQAAANPNGPFGDISPTLTVSGSGNGAISYLDTGAVTNAAARYYRIRLIR